MQSPPSFDFFMEDNRRKIKEPGDYLMFYLIFFFIEKTFLELQSDKVRQKKHFISIYRFVLDSFRKIFHFRWKIHIDLILFEIRFI